MFDIGATELLLIVVVAVVVIGPKDLPLALRTAGRWIGKVRRVSGHFRSGIETMIREAEMEEMDRKWRERNEAIMAQHPASDFHPEDEARPAATPGEGLSAAEAKAAFSADAPPVKTVPGDTAPAPGPGRPKE
ncbi:Sec-independent protein translocase protein TatB [Parerythrobacter aurantius]|uniref:Sec-independent protein translocase protein TatB n=1 Tax=Parerythrobacter aurantius TaxID=3127706 RepID=UPI00324F1F60